MNKLVLPVIVSIILLSGLANASSTGNITFNGKLSANTCDVIVDDQAADATVTLPTVNTNQLAATYDIAGETGFTMVLNNCSGVLTSASAFFEPGPTVNTLTGRLKNLGTASNVSLQLLVGAPPMRLIEVGNQNQFLSNLYEDISTGSATLKYTVRYFAEQATTPGTVTSYVVYSLQYQ